MEIKPNKALTIAMLFSATALASVLAVFHYGERSERGVYSSALKFKKNSSRSVSSAIVFRDEKVTKTNQKLGRPDVSRPKSEAVDRSETMDINTYGARLDSLKVEDLPKLEEARERIISNFRKNGEEIPFHLEFAPELNIALSVLLGVEPSSLSQVDLDKLQFESEQWYFVKAFAASDDFRILLKQKRLSRESLDPAKLKRLYGSAHHFANMP